MGAISSRISFTTVGLFIKWAIIQYDIALTLELSLARFSRSSAWVHEEIAWKASDLPPQDRKNDTCDVSIGNPGLLIVIIDIVNE